MRIALLCAMQQEFNCLSLPGSAAWNTLKSQPFPTYESTKGTRQAVCVVAGVGKSAAAAATQYLVDGYGPSIIISFGLAGALDETARPGDIVFPRMVLQGDTGIYDHGGFQTPASWSKGRARDIFHHEYAADGEAHAWGIEFFRRQGLACRTGPLVTCDQAVFSNHRRRELFRTFGAVAVDMESGAMAQIASLNLLPFVVVRAVSDAHDLEIRDYSQLDKLQADSPLDKARGAAGLLKEPGHLRFLRGMKTGSSLAYRRLGSALPSFIEGCPLSRPQAPSAPTGN
jgi:adenosylhomocysteine nucleosidase